MYDPTDLTLARARRLTFERLIPAIEVDSVAVAVSANTLPGEPVPFSKAVSGDFVPFDVGTAWGVPWSTTWFRIEAEVPRRWAGRRVELAMDLGFHPTVSPIGPGFQAEGLAFAADGTYLKGIEPTNQYVIVLESAVGGDHVEVYVEAAANPDLIAAAFRPTDLGDRLTAPPEPLYRLAHAALVVRDAELAALVADLDVVTGLLEQLPSTDPQHGRLTADLARACDAIRLDDVRSSVGDARALLADALSGPASPSAHRVSAIGHAHIDSAWFWPARETVRKLSRTFSNVLALMDEYPELLFVASSAQQYAWLREHHPALFARVREQVAAGRFIPVGAMWVESDTNLPSGESLVRQFTFGARFFRQEFGVESDVLWLPDSFGYTASLPQIARLAGMRYFLTTKLSWQPVNPFPHHTFLWEGIDGSRLLAHIPPVDTYAAELSPADLAHASRNHRNDQQSRASIVPFGHGDGGGGPTALMMERARRQANLEGSPVVQIETPQTFFRGQERLTPQLPVWVGELYMEGHRGGYTSQAAMKRGNRRSEHLFREAELWSTAAAVRLGAPYPYDQLDRLWQGVLLNQFHDILPGTSIAWVHREARQQYAETAKELEAVIAAAITRLAGDGDRPMAFDAATGSAEPEAVASGAPAVTHLGDETAVDNGLIRVRVDAAGRVRQVTDLRTARDLVPDGENFAELAIHTDFPRAFDAWDLEEYYRSSRRPIGAAESVAFHVEGDRVTVETEYALGVASRVVRTVAVTAGTPAVDVELRVEWQERETILKVEFPIAISATSARSEIPFGYLERPITSNTTWDSQKFEVSAQRWVHVGEGGYGVAIVNESTYGYDFTRPVFAGRGRPGVMARASVLRSPSYPDPGTDRGEHVTRFRVLIGASVADAVDEGVRFNMPSRVVNGSGASVSAPVSLVGAAQISAIKLADDRSGDVVVRLYEALGARSQVAVHFADPVAAVMLTDLHEVPLGQASPVEDGVVTLTLDPFQIVTLRASRR